MREEELIKNILENKKVKLDDITEVILYICKINNYSNTIEGYKEKLKENMPVLAKIKNLNRATNGSIFRELEKVLDKVIIGVVNEDIDVKEKLKIIIPIYDVIEILFEKNEVWISKFKEIYEYILSEIKDARNYFYNYEEEKIYIKNNNGYYYGEIEEIIIYWNLIHKLGYIDFLDKYIEALNKGNGSVNYEGVLYEYLNDSNFTINEVVNSMYYKNKLDENIFKDLENISDDYSSFGKLALSEYKYFNKRLTYINKAIELNDKSATLYFNRALIKIESFDYESALQDISSGLKLELKDDELAFTNYHDEESAILKFLSGLLKIMNNEEIRFLKSKYIFKYILNVNIDKIKVDCIRNNVNLEKVNEINKEFRELFSLSKNIKYINYNLKTLIYAEMYREAFDLIENLGDMKDEEFLYCKTLVLFYMRDYKRSKEISKHLYNYYGKDKYFTIYCSSLYMLEEYEELLEHYNNKTVNYSEEVLKHNKNIVKKRLEKENINNLSEGYKFNDEENYIKLDEKKSYDFQKNRYRRLLEKRNTNEENEHEVYYPEWLTTNEIE